MRTYNKYFETIIARRESGVRSVEFVYRTRVTCTIYMREWHPDRTQGRISFQGKSLKEKPLEAFGIAIKKLKIYDENKPLLNYLIMLQEQRPRKKYPHISDK